MEPSPPAKLREGELDEPVWPAAVPLSIAVTGASGLVGSALCESFPVDPVRVLRLVRRVPRSEDEVEWNPHENQLDLARLEGLDAVVHLAGESIAGRWTKAKKARIRDSRIVGTRHLSEALGRLKQPPKVLVSGSAIGYYGDRGAAILGESQPQGDDFLAKVCGEWEEAAQPARQVGIRVVNLRTALVLAASGGALQRMLLPFQLGLGGRIGFGKQYWSWISLPDLVGVIHHVLRTDSLSGPLNAAAPYPVTNLEFTKTLGKVLRRPTVFPMPAFAARLAFGEMAEALLLPSARVAPVNLEKTGYKFRHPTLEQALRAVLHRPSVSPQV